MFSIQPFHRCPRNISTIPRSPVHVNISVSPYQTQRETFQEPWWPASNHLKPDLVAESTIGAMLPSKPWRCLKNQNVFSVQIQATVLRFGLPACLPCLRVVFKYCWGGGRVGEEEETESERFSRDCSTRKNLSLGGISTAITTKSTSSLNN